MLELSIAVLTLGFTLGGGLPDRGNREWNDHTLRTCVRAGEIRADLDLKGCIKKESEYKKAMLLKDIQDDKWRRKSPGKRNEDFIHCFLLGTIPLLYL